jgi:hypothetical protein
MAVQSTVARALAADSTPRIRVGGAVWPARPQASAKPAAGPYVTSAAIPSRESQEERHCESARQPGLGRPR